MDGLKEALRSIGEALDRLEGAPGEDRALDQIHRELMSTYSLLEDHIKEIGIDDRYRLMYTTSEEG